MRPQHLASKRHFTEAARAAAAEARRRKREAALPKDVPEVFVVRLPSQRLTYGWEIRRFGAVIIEKGQVEHPTMSEARAAGERALSDLAACA